MDKISEMMDGELGEREAREQLARMKQEEELVDGWHTFHVIGDALRGEPVLSQGFSRRLTDRLSGEPTVLSPRRNNVVRRFTTYALSAAASVSAIALVGWVAFVSNPQAPQPELAKAPASASPVATAASAQLASVPSDGKMNDYLIAHQGFSPSTSIQGVAPYIRTVSGSQQDKGR